MSEGRSQEMGQQHDATPELLDQVVREGFHSTRVTVKDIALVVHAWGQLDRAAEMDGRALRLAAAAEELCQDVTLMERHGLTAEDLQLVLSLAAHALKEGNKKG